MKKILPLTILCALICICIFYGLFYNNSSALEEKEQIKWEGSYSSYFQDEDSYIDYVLNTVKIKDINFKAVKIEKRSNFWKIAKSNGINIDTLIAANPHWNSLNASVNQRILVPTEKGVLTFIGRLNEIPLLVEKYKTDEKEILIEDLPLYKKIYLKYSKSDRPIAVFIKNKKPHSGDLSETLAKEFALRELFRSPLGGRYSSYYGRRIDPIFRTNSFHTGLDIAAYQGTPVGASRRGRVTSAGWMGGYGNAVIIEHGDGYRTLYGHLSAINVRQGAFVEAGRFIGRVGSTGLSTGPHLHFTLWRYNTLINPMKVLW
jgi:murein DD-endopeptidase MepM/ murein hydrolase activator NlpD